MLRWLHWKAWHILPSVLQVRLNPGIRGLWDQSKTDNRGGSCSLRVWLKTLPFIVMLAPAFQPLSEADERMPSIQEVEVCRQKITPYSSRSQEQDLLIFNQKNKYSALHSHLGWKHIVSTCDSLLECLFNSLSDSPHHLKPGDIGPRKALLVRSHSFIIKTKWLCKVTFEMLDTL